VADGPRRARPTARGRLEKAGFEDAEEVARDEVARGRPAVVRAALARHLAAAIADAEGTDAVRAAVDLLVDGADRSLGVRWRLVDGDGRAVGGVDVSDDHDGPEPA